MVEQPSVVELASLTDEQAAQLQFETAAIAVDPPPELVEQPKDKQEVQPPIGKVKEESSRK